MSRTTTTIRKLSPILPYGLDVPFTSFSPALHGNYKFNYISDRGDASMKFFEHPIYVHAHGIVRIPKDQYSKISFSILPEEVDFIRKVENNILDTLDRIIDMAEPNLMITTIPRKSITYENLIKLRVNKTVGQDHEGRLVEFDKHEQILIKGVKVLMTVELHGIYHSSTGKGTIARVHCYRVVESF